jgi:hypothetical protein
MKKLATLYTTPDIRGTGLDSVVSQEISWAQFGNEMLLYADEPQWEGLMERAGRDALQLREQRATVKREYMHVVVQNGRLFQQEHSDVPVILDRGRFLLVSLSKPSREMVEAD